MTIIYRCLDKILSSKETDSIFEDYYNFSEINKEK
jgi:hypothetical protein